MLGLCYIVGALVGEGGSHSRGSFRVGEWCEAMQTRDRMRLREGACVGEVAARQWRRAGAAERCMAAVCLTQEVTSGTFDSFIFFLQQLGSSCRRLSYCWKLAGGKKPRVT